MFALQLHIFSVNSKGVFLILPLNMATWFVGSQAVYAMNLPLFGTVAILNLCLGIAIFAFHTLGNPRVRKIRLPYHIIPVVHAR